MSNYKSTSGDYVITCGNGTGTFTVNGFTSVTLSNYSTAEAGNISNPQDGQIIYVTDGDSGSPCLAVYSNGDWYRVTLGLPISL
jgi:hypothetical protein